MRGHGVVALTFNDPSIVCNHDEATAGYRASSDVEVIGSPAKSLFWLAMAPRGRQTLAQAAHSTHSSPTCRGGSRRLLER